MIEEEAISRSSLPKELIQRYYQACHYCLGERELADLKHSEGFAPISPTYQTSSPESIQKMFASIAKNYDRANTLFSFGLHKRWNNKLIQSVQGARNLLDLCSGTGEIAFGFLKRNPKSKAILLDFCHEMLQIAEKKGAAFSPRFETVQADAQSFPSKISVSKR